MPFENGFSCTALLAQPASKAEACHHDRPHAGEKAGSHGPVTGLPLNRGRQPWWAHSPLWLGTGAATTS
eukprot:CAMPEP_0204323454 /NCGR_PEP_ID=MMETSP0469-20131031/9415_1 /ASSEMBLY_ACC=CAM_ASM_000384 /TAXON_ID=2969 /ORGANISM="Oxyrrhis marina" /LENGTH=68 /DNA_ID=CAMNT_0051304915 /DNA_START=45 /DNA_END=248 /DNA_ORIENTATION=+